MGVSGEDPAADSGFAVFRDASKIEPLAHPMRSRIYRDAVAGPVSAKELAEQYEQPLARISYHVKVLADAGLLNPVRRTRRRGAIETHYRGIAPIDIDDEALRSLPVEVRRTLFGVPVRVIADDVLHALTTDALDEPDLFLARAHLRVTDEGRVRLHEEVLRMYERLAELEKELSAEAEAAEGEVHEVNVVLWQYLGAMRAGRNSSFIVSWSDRVRDPPLRMIPE
jgi:DNA-binding transcriptional ArsR family regulator